MKKLALFFVLAMAVGCTTDDTENVPQGMLARKVVREFTGQQYTTRYYYTGHKLERTESSNNTREFYYYDGDLIVNIKRYDDTNLEVESQFQYDATDRLVMRREINDDNTQWRYDYTYNADGTVTVTPHWTSADGVEYAHDPSQYFFENGEVSHITSTSADGTFTVAYTYDDKLVPEHGIVGLDKIRMFEPDAYKGIYHNIVTVTQTSSVNSDVGTYTHLWTYNADGAPTFFMFDDAGTIIIDGGSYQYFYK